MILTTITPYWSRPEQLERWLRCIEAAHHPEVKHLLMVGDAPRESLLPKTPACVEAISCFRVGDESIGMFHNVGAALTKTEWIMKLDVDALPNVEYFTALVEVLRSAGPRQWFNGGMVFLNERASRWYLDTEKGLSVQRYYHVMSNRPSCVNGSYLLPAASNFICRREEYLQLGGCDDRFKGWGWEDYQQIYMLEKHYMEVDPLPGALSLSNVTQRCRDEISRPRARQLWQIDARLCLLHHWHRENEDRSYRSHANQNRAALFDYILQRRGSL